MLKDQTEHIDLKRKLNFNPKYFFDTVGVPQPLIYAACKLWNIRKKDQNYENHKKIIISHFQMLISMSVTKIRFNVNAGSITKN